MANSKDNLQKYGKVFIGFDEPSGNAMDSIGGWTGATFNSPARVTGWNGIGNAIQFNGTNQYVEFNNTLMPTGAISIRLKLKPERSSAWQVVFTDANNSNPANSYGTLLGLSPIDTEFLYFRMINNGFDNTFPFTPIPLGTNGATYGAWIDFCFTWDGQIGSKAKIYVNNMVTPFAELVANRANNTPHSQALFIGRSSVNNANFFKGQMDSIEIYNEVISPIPDKYLVVHNSQYKYHNGTAWQITTATEENFKQYGMSQLSQITEAQWKELSGVKSLAMWSDFVDKKWSNAVLNVEPYTPQQLLGDNSQVIYYTDSGVSDVAVVGNVEPFSVYDYIGELPEVIVHSETTDDISISTNVEPFNIYDEFEDEVEVLYYTNNTDTTGANTILDANWSPVDELGDTFDIVSWTDEADASRALELNAIPKPQLLYSSSIADIANGLNDILATDLSDQTQARFLITADNATWYAWKSGNFVPVVLTNDNIITEGMTAADIDSLTSDDLEAWTLKKFNIGVFLMDDVRKATRAKVSNIGYNTAQYSSTSKVSDIDFYILNTTATINIDLSGLTLTGQVDDADMTRVQYRVILNDEPYYPTNGDFTPLSNPPLNIDLTIRSEDVKIGDWNTLRVEFKDSFGTMDFWEADFLGKYAGIMFMDSTGQYYSTDVGQVLQYLDFGQILTGQITPSYEIKVKNEYGFDVHDATVTVNTSKFAEGLTVQLASETRDFENGRTLPLGNLANDETKSFFIRMVSDVSTIPNANTEFDIVVLATRTI